MRVVRSHYLLGRLITVSLKRAVAFVDGASRGNPGPASAGVVIQTIDGEPVKSFGVRLGQTTNNVAEWCALILALQEGILLKLESLDIRTDSELVARQISGEYKVKEPTLQPFFQLARHLQIQFKGASVRHVPREQNKLADAEANRALDELL